MSSGLGFGLGPVFFTRPPSDLRQESGILSLTWVCFLRISAGYFSVFDLISLISSLDQPYFLLAVEGRPTACLASEEGGGAAKTKSKECDVNFEDPVFLQKNIPVILRTCLFLLFLYRGAYVQQR